MSTTDNIAGGRNPLDDFTIGKSAAGSDYSRKKTDSGGVYKTGVGANVTRIDFTSARTSSLATTADKAAAVRVKIPSDKEKSITGRIVSILTSRKFVPLGEMSINGTKTVVHVNVQSLAKRLGLSTSQIRNASKNGNLDKLVMQRHSEYVEEETLRDDALNAFENQPETPSPDGRAGSFTKKIGQIVFIASTTLKDQEFATFSSKTNPTGGKHQDLYVSVSGSKMQISHLTDSKKLGEGTFGKVFKARNLLTGQNIIRKAAYVNKDILEDLLQQADIRREFAMVPDCRGNDDYRIDFEENIFDDPDAKVEFIKKKLAEDILQYAEADAANEKALLEKLNPNGNIIGIQKPPHQACLFTDEGQQIGKGYFAHAYDGDLAVFSSGEQTLVSSQKINFALQLIQGGMHCARAGVILGDIKPANCLFSGQEAVLSDFGGARVLSSKPDWGVHTMNYCCPQDLNSFFKLNDENKTDELNKLLLARDVYALGCTLMEICNFSAADLYPNDDDTPSVAILKETIQSMLNDNYTKRPTMEAAYKNLSIALLFPSNPQKTSKEQPPKRERY